MVYSLHNKVVLITGGSIGIGESIALAFAPQGPRLVLTYRTHADNVERVATECRTLGADEVLTIQLDVANDDNIKKVVDAVARRFGQIDILINNAGIILWKHFADQSWQEIEDQLRINLEGLIKTTKAALPHIKDVIVNLSSAGGLKGYEDITVYCATKFGVRGFSQALAEELSTVRVYSINPGVIATQMNDFQGHPPSVVAEAVLDAVTGRSNILSGGDVDVF
jgi:short-subunit dehydrogenase